jgi:hypothetical protein
MQEFSTGRYNFDKQNEEQKSARERMALFPTSPSSGEGKEEQDDENEVKVIYTNENMWVVRSLSSPPGISLIVGSPWFASKAAYTSSPVYPPSSKRC